MTTSEARPTGADASAPNPHLGRLSLRNFRNFGELVLELPARGVAIIGPNGSGKTNLLEAIYYLEILRSFRGARDARLVRFGQQVFRVEGELHGVRSDGRLAAAFDKEGRRKKAWVDGIETDRLSAGIGRLGAVVFRLEDVEIVRAGPEARRRYLDVLLSLAEPAYLPALQRYRTALAQRNEALRAGGPATVVEAWTDALLEPAGRVMAARATWCSERAGAFSDYCRAIAGDGSADLAYRPSAPLRDEERPESVEAWAAGLRVALEERREEERRRGMTMRGPHRDDLRLTHAPSGEDARDLRVYGSSGQQRTAALALRLIETDTLSDRLGREPLYLLDDVFAELDEERCARTLALLDEDRSGQVVLTAPKPGELELRGGALDRWRIRNGRVLG